MAKKEYTAKELVERNREEIELVKSKYRRLMES